LRAVFDAIHLASALELQGAVNERVTFVADRPRGSCVSAAEERLATVNPETGRTR
jgi:hypothetical protein